MSSDTPMNTPHAAQKEASTTTPTSVLNQEVILKFCIGLRLLGEQKKERYLAYILTRQEQKDENKQPPKQQRGVQNGS